jgi:imidazoleglycerol-phosphate dehydratase/histidinol-phosphatase
VQDAVAIREIDTLRSAVLSPAEDRDTYGVLAKNLGVASFSAGNRLDQDFELILAKSNVVSFERRTLETKIKVRLMPGGREPTEIVTGIGFFDHMLEQLAKHGGMSIQLRAQGDLHVDEHHLIEDTAIALGSALRRVIGNGFGLNRYGFALPMDEARASVLIDLSGRPYSVFKALFSNTRVGGLDTDMVEHFFRSFAEALKATVHVELTGSNSHHMIEAGFKALGRALKTALTEDSLGSGIPSTKGVL